MTFLLVLSSAKKEKGTRREVSSKMLKMVRSCLSFSLLAILELVALHSYSLVVKYVIRLSNLLSNSTMVKPRFFDRS